MKRRPLLIFVTFFCFLSFVIGYLFNKFTPKSIDHPYNTNNKIIAKPYEKYSILNLQQAEIVKGIFQIDKALIKNDKYSSYLFYYQFDSDLDGILDKKTSGIINLPNQSGSYPVILMLRGYVDQKIYTSGMGTKNASNFFAENGFITVAPDFLGYADSDSESGNIFESRFQTYITALSLLKYFESNKSISLEIGHWNLDNLTMWGHSNGGQIALTLLEVTKENIPTVLWAPVSKPFPYSILYYTDESEDRGKLIRKELSEFEKLYDVENYSLSNYLDQINAPIQIHQGSGDDAVPIDWSNSLVNQLRDLNVEIDYFTYPGADHNLQPVWNTVIERSLDFYNNFLQNK